MEPVRCAMEDKLHIGGVRPYCFWGVPFTLAVPILMLGAILWIQITGLQGGLWAAVVCVPSWALAWIVTSRDPYGLSVAWSWLLTTFMLLDRFTWGGASLAPLPLKNYSKVATDAG